MLRRTLRPQKVNQEHETDTRESAWQRAQGWGQIGSNLSERDLFNASVREGEREGTSAKWETAVVP